MDNLVNVSSLEVGHTPSPLTSFVGFMITGIWPSTSFSDAKNTCLKRKFIKLRNFLDHIQSWSNEQVPPLLANHVQSTCLTV